MCTGYFVFFNAASQHRFLVSRSRSGNYARDKEITVRENNLITKRVQLIFKLSRVWPLLLASFSHHADVSRIACDWLNTISEFPSFKVKHL